ncbi:hypothetical protein PBY51_014501 [Eleginops maclovinus]|uniref:Mitochondrial import inner membrane translocase subunit Tim21 n=1 Tax=Eleginops maclovinus TaxID=56733 RepID=A0AAN7WVH0_ELEMC|nr:hypothetical protein PBY51_014501 [Eleginops maclovinus]
MAYTQILRALHRTATQKYTHVSFLVHTHRTACMVSGLTVLHRTGAHRTVMPVLSSFLQAQRGVSLRAAARNQSSPEDRDRSVSRYQSGSPEPSAAQKVKAAGRDFTYLIVVLIGLGVTGGLLFVVFQELFSSSSPNKVYGKAFNIIRLDPGVVGAFGEPIKCYGETTRRGRRQQVSHHEFLKDGVKHLRLKFYIEVKENPQTGKYEFRYIIVEVDTYPRRTIIVEDNR